MHLINAEKEVLAKIAAAASLPEVLEDLVVAIENTSADGMLASILLLDSDGRHLLHGAAPNLPEAYNSAIHGVEIGPSVGSCGTAAHLARPVYVSDIASDPLWEDFRDLALEHNLRACWSTPIAAADGRVLGTFAIYYREPRSPTRQDIEAISSVTRTAAIAIERHLDITNRQRAEKELAEQAHTLKIINRTWHSIAAELDLRNVVQLVTDAGVELTGAEFGAFFYNVCDDAGEKYMLYALSGVDRSAFEKFPMPRNTAVFAPTFSGEAVVRSDDITQDSRYGKNQPNRGMPAGHLPVRSYLAVPVKARSGEVLGGLFFGHSKPGIFTATTERTIVGIAAQAAIAMDNAKLFEAAQREIADRKRTEEALRLRGEEFSALADNIPTLCWIAYPDGHIHWYNRRWYEYTGTSPESQAGWGWKSVHDPEHLPYVIARWQRSIDTGEPFEMTFPLRGADGVFRPFLTRVVPIRDETNRIVRWFGTNVDITEQREAEARLAQSVQERTRERDQLWDLSEDLLAVANYEGKLLRASPSWTRLFGYDQKTLLTRPYGEIIHPDDFEATMDALLAMRSNGRPAAFENRVRAADGTWRWVAWTVSPEPGGERLIAVGRDMTAEKARQAELKQAQEHLRQAQKMEAVGQLTGGLAHDFNNLLAGIMGSLDLMQARIAQGRTDAIERYAKAAISSAQRAAALTHRLLAFSRRQSLDPKPVNANQLVTGMEELLRRTIGPLHALEFVTAGGLWMTLCDPNQLESAILNLAINARDAMPDGGKLTIETCNAHLDDAYVAAQRDIARGQYICICITDTGVGMSRDVIARAVEPFFTTKPLGQGTGLGLSMVYGFAKQSEGHLKIYSEEGKGTTVKIYLPRHRGPAEAEEVAAPVGESPRAEAGETVLVVEDEPVIRDLIVEVLQDLGYRALEAADGPAGLKILQSHTRIDLLVTDVGLPGLNGRQLADQARVSRTSLKVLFITGYAGNATLANGFLEPGMEMITKPFAVEALASKIRNMIQAD